MSSDTPSTQDSPTKRVSFGARGQIVTLALALIAMLASTTALHRPPSEGSVVAASGTDFGASDDLTVDTGGTGSGSAGTTVRRAGGAATQGAGGTSADGGTEGGNGTAVADPKAQADCAKGINDGATEKGVTETKIKFAATIVKRGVAKDFLSDAQHGIEAVRQKVNAAGGICGRELVVDYQDDGWIPDEGQRIIEGWIASGDYFGLAVNPSSEGLRGAIDSGLIDSNEFPVVGADGMLENQYKSPWVWPVATSTASVMRIMVKQALAEMEAQGKAKTFGIVWENNYRFGVEGQKAFVDFVKKNGGEVNSDVGIPGGQNDYANQVNTFLGNCGGAQSLSKCNFLAFLLEPATASQWKRNGGFGDPNVRPAIGMGAPQPLFLNSFARDCAASCRTLWVWTSFKPPLDPFINEAAVQQYKQDLAAVNSGADANNPHVEGAYVGMSLLVDVLEKLGPDPTRAKLKALLDSTVFDSKLGEVLDFKANGKYAADSAQAYEAIVQGGSFSNWRYTNSGFIADPSVGG